jgi:hypothetical protein
LQKKEEEQEEEEEEEQNELEGEAHTDDAAEENNMVKVFVHKHSLTRSLYICILLRS